MKKRMTSMLAALLLLCSGCDTGLLGGLGGLGGDPTGNGSTTGGLGGLGDILGGVIGVLGSQNTVDGLLGLVIGSVKVQESELVAAEHCKEKMAPVYNTLGINAQNTQFQFTQDHQFAANVKGIPLSGTYTYDPSTATIKVKTMLFSSNVYVTRTTQGLAYTFESKNLLKVLQAIAAVSGNSTLQTVGDLSKQYDGVRLGFDMAPAR